MPCTIICRVCGDCFDLPDDMNHCPCRSCGAENSRPQVTQESFDKLQRATQLRLEGHRDEALRCYEHVLTEYEDEHEALWGKLLCQYGVEFVTDPKSGVRHATVHVPHSRPMQLHGDFRRACELAPAELRAQYEAEADYVDEALMEINRRKEASEPYDVFLCHKTTHLTGPGYTEDYNRAVQLTRRLEKAGYRVFFAPFADLQPGASYEAGIYYALWTAKVMLLISSDVAFLNSPWVKSEWTRYLEMLDDGADKHLIPLMYGGLAEVRLPREIRLRRLQSIRMEDVDATEKLMRALERYTGQGKKTPVEPEPKPVQAESVKPETARPEPVKPTSVKPEPVKSKPIKPQPAPVQYAPESNFTIEAVEGGVSITKYTGEGGEVNIPPTIGGQRVVEIGDWAFYHCGNLLKVTIPEGVKNLGFGVFKDCRNLMSLRLPQSVISIRADAFSGCSRLSSINIPDAVKFIGQSAFAKCPMLKLPLSVKLRCIGSNIFG